MEGVRWTEVGIGKGRWGKKRLEEWEAGVKMRESWEGPVFQYPTQINRYSGYV